MEIMKMKHGNKIISGKNIFPENATVNFTEESRNNILYLEGDLSLCNSEILFYGENSIVFLREGAEYKLKVSIFNDSAFYVGKNNFFSNKLTAILSEQKHIFLGDNGNYSHGIWIRNADPHLVYSTKDMKRKNYSKSIYIGDHVWIGQNALLLKGAQIASGSIVGAGGIVAGKKIKSNTAWAGNPVKLISKDVFWSRESVHAWRTEDTARFAEMNTTEYIYKFDAEQNVSFDEIDKTLSELKTAEEKMNYLMKISKNNEHNRFAF